MKLTDWITDRTLPYIAAASACSSASSAYSRSGAKGRSRMFCALALGWLGMTVLDIWKLHSEQLEDSADSDE